MSKAKSEVKMIEVRAKELGYDSIRCARVRPGETFFVPEDQTANWYDPVDHTPEPAVKESKPAKAAKNKPVALSELNKPKNDQGKEPETFSQLNAKQATGADDLV